MIILQCHVCKNVKFTNKKTKTLDILFELSIRMVFIALRSTLRYGTQLLSSVKPAVFCCVYVSS